MSRRIRRSVEPTDDWKQLKLLCRWPEQERYEEIRPLVLFDASVADRAEEVGTSASTLYRRLSRFEEGGMENLFDAPTAKRKKLPPAIRRLILDLKAEYPRFTSTR
jgi:transposase